MNHCHSPKHPQRRTSFWILVAAMFLLGMTLDHPWAMLLIGAMAGALHTLFFPRGQRVAPKE